MVSSATSGAIRGRLFRLSPKTLFTTEISNSDFDQSISKSKVVVLGEYHGEKAIVGLQTYIQERMADSMKVQHQPSIMENKSSLTNVVECEGKQLQDLPQGKVRLVLEHFSTDMQDLLNRYNSGELDVNGLKKGYKEIGTEGHNLTPYIPSLESARIHPHISIYGGFIPRSYARLLMKEGKGAALQAATQAGFISNKETLDGTDEHYNYFESLLTGRNMYLNDGVLDRFREKMFPAQIIKDASMAFRVKNLLRNYDVYGEDKILVVCGVGHMLHSHGVPERILTNSSSILENEDMLRVACLPMPPTSGGKNKDGHDDDGDLESLLIEAYGGPEWDAADVCFLYEENEVIGDENEMSSIAGQIRNETREAYDKVGSTAHLTGGDMIKAHYILTSLNYTPEEIFIAGEDAVNYQGVGCPHRYANIQKGELVLDMGSGLGVDSILATARVGKSGRVVGIDLSSECVDHANARARARGVDSILSFVHSPLEEIRDKIDDTEECFDVVISNGAFCLLPDKVAGFSECYRLLKPKGRMVICTTVVKNDLDDGVEWPLCMQTFAKMDKLEAMLERLGFEDIEIDLSDSLMETPAANDEEQVNGTHGEEEYEEGRFKVHNEEGREKYQHLEHFDMNKLCARVVIKANKP